MAKDPGPFIVNFSPALPVKVTAKNTGFFINHPDQITDAINSAMRSGLFAAALLFSAQLAKATPTGYTGNARKAWKTDTQETSSGLVITIYNPFEYLLAVDQGRKAAWVRNYPPSEPLTKWVQKKLGISNLSKARGIAFCISRKKSQVATPGQHFGEKTIIATRPKASKLMDSYMKNAFNQIGADSTGSTSSK